MTRITGYVMKEEDKTEPELLHEDRQSAELAGVDEVEEAPELPQVVLQGRPGEDQPVRGVQLLHSPRHLHT